MRNIKQLRFRSWDVKNNIMIGPWDIGSEASFEWNPDMQFTGMTDENGNGIYEDDIVIVSCDEAYTGEGLVIEPDEYPEKWEFKGCVVFKYYGWFVDNENSYIPFCDIETHSMSIKIIGNIFEGEKP